ncbi:MAG: DUF2334 domain-containing protein [Meiothermus sp.]|nr:DUF2334 domain-containing protein [Meiothermus sp.]
MKRAGGWRWGVLALFLLGLLVLAACGGSQPALYPEDSELEAGLNAQATTAVLVLYDDSMTVASEGEGVSLQAQKKLFRPKPGVVRQRMDIDGKKKDKNKDKDHEDEGEDNELSKSSGEVSAQAYNYLEAAQLYATFLTNLLGRYADVTVTRKPVSQYAAGDTGRYAQTFYIGSTYDNPIPQAFVNDIAAGGKVVWINYNLWRLGGVLQSLGLTWVAVRPEYQPSEYAVGFNRVSYRGYTYTKYPAPMEVMEVAADATVTVDATIANAAGRTIPFVVRKGNFWYVADNPFVYMHETDRYLVFADLIAPMMGRDATCAPRALARMEDLNPNNTAADLKRMLDAVVGVSVPFSATVIPLYRDARVIPAVQKTWASNSAALAQIRRIPNIGGRVYQHGYTHQFDNLANPYGETGDDFEFWRVTLNPNGTWLYVGPIPNQTSDSAVSRINTGRSIINGLSTLSSNMTPRGWTTPHYAMEPNFYAGVRGVYSRVFERRLYRVGSMVGGQFFPYPVRDVSGTLVVPENMGSIEPNWPVAKIVEVARANRALRCPWSGHFFHPYILDPAYDGPEALSVAQFQKMFLDIKALGYTYVDSVGVGLQ